MLHKTIQKPKGFIAMVSMLIVTGVAMFLAVGMLLDGVDSASLSVSSISYENARINTSVCLEDFLLRIKQEETFSQNLSYTISTGETCSTTITWFDPVVVSPGIQERLATLDVQGVSGNFTRTFRYELRVARFDVNHPDGSLDYLNSIEFVSITELTS